MSKKDGPCSHRCGCWHQHVCAQVCVPAAPSAPPPRGREGGATDSAVSGAGPQALPAQSPPTQTHGEGEAVRLDVGLHGDAAIQGKHADAQHLQRKGGEHNGRQHAHSCDAVEEGQPKPPRHDPYRPAQGQYGIPVAPHNDFINCSPDIHGAGGGLGAISVPEPAPRGEWQAWNGAQPFRGNEPPACSSGARAPEEMDVALADLTQRSRASRGNAVRGFLVGADGCGGGR